MRKRSEFRSPDESVLVIGRDALDRCRFAIVDPKRSFEWHRSGHRELAPVTIKGGMSRRMLNLNLG